ncbi:hypothetical protein BH09PAT1_BH09PAT1_5650 [soil metagenome]
MTALEGIRHVVNKSYEKETAHRFLLSIALSFFFFPPHFFFFTFISKIPPNSRIQPQRDDL